MLWRFSDADLLLGMDASDAMDGDSIHNVLASNQLNQDESFSKILGLRVSIMMRDEHREYRACVTAIAPDGLWLDSGERWDNMNFVPCMKEFVRFDLMRRIVPWPFQCHVEQGRMLAGCLCGRRCRVT